MRNLKSRLRELVESIQYQKDFKELKKSILLLKEQKKYIKGIFPVTFTRIEPSQPGDTAIRHGRIFLKELQGLLKKGNVNDHQILIPDAYSNFKSKYGLKFLSDPEKPYPEFNPFDDKPIVAQLPLDGGTRITMTVDISFPIGILEERFKATIRGLKDKWELKQGRKERYSDDDIYNIKKLSEKGLSAIEITRLKFPGFKPMNDYVFNPEEKRQLKIYDAWAYYKKVLRLSKKGETRLV